MKKVVLLFLGIACLALMSRGQGVEDELGFKYLKAKYLMETERYEEAIKAFTIIIKEDATYEEALLYRAEAKYAMAAYKGTKKDVLEYIGYNGITEKSLMLLGKSDYKLDNKEAALRTLLVATGSALSDNQIYEYIGNIYQEQGKLLKACDFWAEGAILGSTKCETKSRKVCGNTTPSQKKNKNRNEDKDSGGLGKAKTDDVLASKKDEVKIDIKGKKEKSKKDMEDEETSDIEIPTKNTPKADSDLPPDDDTANEIEIDDELSITIYGNGLGKRRVLDQPNILIMSDDVGEVAIDICINKRGKVESAELNTDLSTIKKQSLVSLAIRKAKDFWFEKNDYKEQCGVMIFNKKK